MKLLAERSSIRSGFTLIELLVVIAIIAVLAALLVPAVSAAIGSARAIACLSNQRQWGIALTSYLSDNGGTFPWDGDDPVLSSDFAHKNWWPNALPPYMNMPTYLTIQPKVPVAPQATLYTCRSATSPSGAPYKAGAFKYYFDSVFNSKMNSGIPAANADGEKLVGEMAINIPCATVAFVEMRSVPDEISKSDPNYSKSLLSAKACWTRMSARHSKGGNIVFCDGHAGLVNYAYTQESNNGDYNHQDLIWNPMGPAN